MARAAAQQGKAKPKAKEAARATAKKKPKTAPGGAKGGATPKAKASPGKEKPKKAATGGKRAAPPARKRAAAPAPAGRAFAGTSLVPPPEAPRLLRQTKNTSAALTRLEKGIELLFAKDIRKARAEFDALLSHYPAELEIVARARTYLQICDREEAGRKKSPANPDEIYALGIMEHNQGDYDRAIAHFRKSLEKHPEADYIHYSMAASLAMKGEADAAIENLRRAIKLDEDSRVHARNDSDFSSLESHPEFQALVGLPSPQPSGPA
jgi:tetratricopeptide (TPR) repeat protein